VRYPKYYLNAQAVPEENAKEKTVGENTFIPDYQHK
jgi:hypothetical protein